MPTTVPRHIVPVARSFATVAAIGYVLDLLRQTQNGLTDGAGRPFGDDFVNYWSGAFLALHGRAAEVYDLRAFHAVEQGIVGVTVGAFHYSYPPVLLLLTAPMALVPYVPALLLWLLASWYAFYRSLKLAMPGRGALLLALAAPAVFINAIGGQNGCWTAALFGFGLGFLEKRPLFAGGLLGLLIYKPQLGLLIPAALLAGRHWRAFFAAAAVAVVLPAISWLWFGTVVWADFLRNIGELQQVILEDGTGVWHRFVSVFVAMRRLGATVDMAYAAQAVTGITALVAVVLTWRRKDVAAGIKNAVLVVGTCLTTPYLQDYDLVFGALVVAWLWHAPAPVSERVLLISCGLLLTLPFLAAALAHLTGLAFGPIFIMPIFVVALSMGLRTNQPLGTGAAPLSSAK